ncbi:degV family protein [Thermincola potens JR]|uniref:DegV family protein n=2 Tax=Thermincola TaxID=278993 RepID=D5X8R9_THEPJ|nr:degV family protein [Thermincola potens JR]
MGYEHMADLVIVTDSTADLPPQVLHQYGIEVVPLKVMFGDEVYRDGVDITFGEFIRKMESSGTVPTTSQPAPGEFAAVYERILQEQPDAHIISIHLSAQMSGTVHSARLAKSMVNEEKIEVIDSKMVSLALGVIVLEAAKAARAGKDKEEVLKIIDHMIEKTRTYFLVDTLDYLQRGGRIGKAQSLLGTLLHIKPILTFNDGFISPYDKVRGLNKAIQVITDSINEEFGKNPVSCAFVYGTDMELFNTFYNKIKSEVLFEETVRAQLGCVVGAHGGPGIVGVICYSF